MTNLQIPQGKKYLTKNIKKTLKKKDKNQCNENEFSE